MAGDGPENRSAPQPVDVRRLAAAVQGRYANQALAEVNDHVVRLSVMTEPFYWHRHPDSDETFLVVEGRLRIELEDGAVELGEGEMVTVPAGAAHRTLPVGLRSVNLTFERVGAETVRID